MEIDEIVNRLLGDIHPLCETNEDEKRYENIFYYEKVLEIITNELIECAKWNGDYRYSANKIGERTYNILKRTIDIIEDELRTIDEDFLEKGKEE